MEMEYGYTFGDPSIGEDYRRFATFDEMAESIRREPLQAVIEHIAKSNMRNGEVLKLCFERMGYGDMRHLLYWAQDVTAGRNGGNYSREDAVELAKFCGQEIDRRESEGEESPSVSWERNLMMQYRFNRKNVRHKNFR